MILLLSTLLACSGDEPAVAPVRSGRFDAPVAPPSTGPDPTLTDFCEVHHTAADAPRFAYPELDEPAPAATDAWRWVNVWATWCGPCVEEMPMLVTWQARLEKEGLPAQLEFLSVDAKAEDVTKWRASHAAAPPSVRVKTFSLVAPWLGTLGVGADAVIPIHAFVAPDGGLRCVRTGAVDDGHYATIKKLISGG